MAICDLCEYFTSKRYNLQWISNGIDGNTLHHMHVCNECKEWLEKMFEIRGRYVSMVKEEMNRQ